MSLRRRFAVVAVCVVAVPTLVVLAAWAWNRTTGRCGLLDEQGFACEPPFTAEDARRGRIAFELVREDSHDGTHLVRFSGVNNTDGERSLGWHDLHLVTARGEEVRCLWGDDSYPRYELLPQKRILSYRSCEVPSGELTLHYHDVEVARS